MFLRGLRNLGFRLLNRLCIGRLRALGTDGLVYRFGGHSGLFWGRIFDLFILALGMYLVPEQLLVFNRGFCPWLFIFSVIPIHRVF